MTRGRTAARMQPGETWLWGPQAHPATRGRKGMADRTHATTEAGFWETEPGTSSSAHGENAEKSFGAIVSLNIVSNDNERRPFVSRIIGKSKRPIESGDDCAFDQGVWPFPARSRQFGFTGYAPTVSVNLKPANPHKYGVSQSASCDAVAIVKILTKSKRNAANAHNPYVCEAKAKPEESEATLRA